MTRRIIAAAVAAIVVITAVWWFALWRPQTAKLAAAHRSVAAAEASDNQLLGHLAELRRLEARVPELKKSLSTLESQLPNNAGLDVTIRQINQAAQSAGVSWQSLTPQLASSSGGGTLPPGDVSSITLSITVTGTYFQIMSFLHNLYGLSRLMVINNLNLSSNGNQQLAASMTSEVFFRPGGAS